MSYQLCLHSTVRDSALVKNPPANAGDTGSSPPGSGRSPGRGNGNPLPVLLPGKPTDRGAWWATVHGVAKSRTRLSTSEKAMATHSSVLAWRIPGMEEPGGLLSVGSHRVGHDGSDLAAAAEHVEQWFYKAALIAMVTNSSASFKGIVFSDLLLISKTFFKKSYRIHSYHLP